MSISDTTDKQSVPIECHQDGWVLTNKIALSSKQAEKFLDFLVAEEETLFLIAADDDRDVREACLMVVDLGNTPIRLNSYNTPRSKNMGSVYLIGYRDIEVGIDSTD
jgi:hypothetical protein